MSPFKKSFAILLLAFAVASLAASAQPPTAPDNLPRFEVATIKSVPANAAAMDRIKVYPSGEVVISAFSLKRLVLTAFHLTAWQISGGEEWMDKDRYDVVAKPAEESPSRRYDVRYGWTRIEDPRLRQMLQALLIDRFQLKVRRETPTGQIYLLAKSGKPIPLKPVELPVVERPSGSEGFGSVGNAGTKWGIYNTSMQQLANFVSEFYLHRPILDQTGLAGAFTFEWKMIPPDPEHPDVDPQLGSKEELMQFIQVMGLKLTPSTGPVETFVIDHAEKPTPN